MPMYEFKCKECGLSVDRDMPTLDSHVHVLNDDLCYGEMKRVYSVGFQLKSTDWGH